MTHREAPELWITGAGLITGLGVGLEANWRALCAGESGLRPIGAFDTSAVEVHRGGEAPSLPEPPGDLDLGDRRDRAQAYLRWVCHEALSQAGLRQAPDPERAALVLGSSLAAQASAPAFWESFRQHGEAGADYSTLKSYDVERRLDDLCQQAGVAGEALLVSNACAAGGSALALAAASIRLGRADFVLAAGYDALDLHTFSGFNAIKALAPDGLRPFSAGRAGMQLGDGFAALIVERAETARAAGRRPLARLLGAGESADAHHLTQPDPQGQGAALAMQRALADAGLSPADVDYVNAHATSTPANDVAEWRALERVFGERVKQLPVSASKAAFGHTLGGAGAVEAAVCLMALVHQALPPTLGLGELDAEIEGPFDRVPEARPAQIAVAMSNSFGFGGCNASVVLGRVEA